MNAQMFNELSQPFPANQIKFRAGATNREKTQAQALAYIDARNVMERLDAVAGAMNWSDSYQVIRSYSSTSRDGDITEILEVECALTINGVTKKDVGSGEDAKSAYSDAFKRVAVKFGVGRYLYDFPKQWVAYDAKRKALSVTPSLPGWAIPAANPSTSSGRATTTKATPAVAQTASPVTAEPTPAVVSDEQRFDQLFAQITRPQQKRLHQLGRLVYGREWDEKRGEIVAWHTNQRTHSSRDLSQAETETLIEKLVKKAVKAGLKVPVFVPEDVNDVLF